MGKFTLKRLIWDQRRPMPPVPEGHLSGKTVMMVGCNSGLGFEATKHFCKMGPARVILAARSEERGRLAVQEIKRETGIEVELWLVDLARLASVVEFSERFVQDGGRLDLLVYNAAVLEVKHSATPDGYEATIAVNHISAAVLCLALLPRLVETAAKHGGNPRIVQVASDVHYMAKFKKQVLDSPNMLEKLSEKEYCTWLEMATRYNLSKLLNVMFVRQFAQHLPATSPVVINSVNPGYCLSGLRRQYKGLMGLIDKCMEYFLARTSEEGSRQIVFAAVGHPEEADKMKGAYISLDYAIEEESDYIFTPEGQMAENKLWEDTLTIAYRSSPKIRAIVDEYLAK